MSKIVQNNFTGGMSALWDSTKTTQNQFRIGLNCRIRKNTIAPAFKPVKVNSPAGKHQALLTLDDKLIAIINGKGYWYDIVNGVLVTIGAFPPMSTAVDVIYHAEVPVPSNMLVGSFFSSNVSTLPEAAVLQDGQTQPVIIEPSMSARFAHTFAQWLWTSPEYVPIGKQMAKSGNKLYIASPDGKKIYQSVSGRCLDFVLNFEAVSPGDDGDDLVIAGDADTTYLAVSAATLTALKASQNAGFLAFTAYQAYAGIPVPEIATIFGELYVDSIELFPVGALNQQAFTFSNGETVFVSSSGIQVFNQVQQLQQESNNNPFSAPIIDFLVRPITRAATITIDGYTLFAMQTVFGDGIIFYDNHLQSFVGIDLVGAVKEFAILRAGGLSRLFYITYGDELYELPLYDGETAAPAIYFGEYNTQSPNNQIKADKVHLAFNNIKTSGDVTVEIFADRVLAAHETLELEAIEPASVALRQTPVGFPLEGNSQASSLTFDVPTEYAYALGIAIHWRADAVLSSMSFDHETREVDQLSSRAVARVEETFLVLGDIVSDSTTIGGASVYAAAVLNQRYAIQSTSDNKFILNGSDRVSLQFAWNGKTFKAKANEIAIGTGVTFYDYDTLGKTLALIDEPTAILLLGDVGNSVGHGGAFSYLETKGVLIKGVAGELENETSTIRNAYLGYLGAAGYELYSTEYVDFYLFNFNIDNEDVATLDANGVITPTPLSMVDGEQWARWLELTIAQRDNGKFNVVVMHFPPYSESTAAPGFATLRWDYKRYGVDLVLAAHTNGAYERIYEAGVYYINVGTGHATGTATTTAGLGPVTGGLVLSATAGRLRGTFKGTDGKIRDEFTIIAS